jgi:SAM-dependent methyltransferase
MPVAMNGSSAIAFAAPCGAEQIVRCPLCDEPPPFTFRTRDEIAAELAMRDAFFARRLDRRRSRDELRDVTSMLLGTPADVLRCAACGILIRDGAPDDDAFRDDRYERAVLESLHVVHAAAFHEKEPDYRSLLRSGARVLEVGSYAGGFLSISRRWGWNATGVDIGGDTSRFSRALGFNVRSDRLEECGFESDSFDGVFIWNCFEQLSAPRIALAEAHRILRRFGILVIRVPDADFYAGRRMTPRTSLAALAYNGLLGWPHQFGFGAAALRRFAAEHRFTEQRLLRAPAIRPLRNALRAWAQDEESALLADRLGWIELTLRKG